MSEKSGPSREGQPGGFAGRFPGRFPGGGGPGGGPGAGPVIKAKNTRQTMRRIWVYLSLEKRMLWVIFILVILSTLLNLAGPYLIGVAIDRYIVPGNLRGLQGIAFIMLGTYGAQSVTVWLQNYWMISTGQKTVQRMRKDLFEKLQLLPLRFFDSKPHGELMSRLTNDLENTSNALSNNLTQVMTSLITIVGTLAMMLWLSSGLTIVSLVVIPLIAFSARKIGRHTRIHFSEQQKNLGHLNGLIEETIAGQKVVKVFCYEGKAIEKFSERNLRLKKVGIKAQVFAGLMGPTMNVLNNLSFAMIAAAGGWLVVKQVITVGVVVTFLNYSRQFTRPLIELANQFNLLQSAVAGAERVFEVVDEEPEPADREGAASLENIAGAVTFDRVSFAYPRGTPVLKNFNLRVEPGQTIALVGPTGAGKTTVINLLTRFYDVEEGSISIDGHDIRTVKRNSLRSLLGIVLQDTYLFADSVRENIRYGRLDASDEEVESAAKLANAHHFIRHLPQGYDTALSDDGGNLSFGQRQLLAIARAILADPSILILDEATSGVDTLTEIHIQQALLNLMKGRTSFVIAHRLSTIRQADQIIVIDDGQIVEQGTHRELLAQKGSYYRMSAHQYDEQVS